ncbi:hypothetical protein RI129_001384 [Pyrocoelia pectoralis]|uniref:Brinker DNA-binding domain-containing protein n=1 Tax=Pyrocoelia pectoralis TaxID=417401 RepID=A0AAN7VMV6_9COLE
MAHGLNSVLKRGPGAIGSSKGEGKSGIGSRRIFAPHFKLQVLDSYRNDADCKGNQRATARKYGIHRRQIQKWLQCENNLRNSVGKSKVVSAPEARKCGAELSLRSGQHRQRDDLCNDVYSQSLSVEVHVHGQDAYSQTMTNSEVINANDAYDLPNEIGSEARVPSLILAPLDYTTHSRSQSVSPIDWGTPIDLSLKRPMSLMEVGAPVCCPLSPQTSRIPSPSCLVPFIQPHPDIWDLSTRNEVENTDIRYSPNIESPPIENPPKPVKLFKPYLDDLRDDDENKSKDRDANTQPCCNRFIPSLPENEPNFCNNNYITPDYTYSLYELQPKNTINYYYTINKNYLCSPECENLSFCASYENSVMLPQHSPSLKQRQSYSVDFKLSAIECYYQDTICRGNQRAVANKYNIHRRQVQKWLKQEDELRHRNDFTRNVNVVR